MEDGMSLVLAPCVSADFELENKEPAGGDHSPALEMRPLNCKRGWTTTFGTLKRLVSTIQLPATLTRKKTVVITTFH